MKTFLFSLCLVSQFFLLHRVNGQDFDLIDSLVKKSVMPIVGSETLNSIDSNTIQIDGLRSPYNFILKTKNRDVKILYVLVDKDSAYKRFTKAEKYDSIVKVPLVHPVFFYTYARVNKKKINSFSIDHHIKNSGDSFWTTADYIMKFKVLKGKDTVESTTFTSSNFKPHKEGVLLNTKHDLYLNKNIYPWNHITPNIFRCTFDFINTRNGLSETFRAKVGFRQVRIANNNLFVNSDEVILKSARLDRYPLDIDSLYNFLRDLRANNFNSIILATRGNKHFFNICDSIGLYVIQEIRPDMFNSLSDLLNYFVCHKDSPSLITWKNMGAQQEWINILRRLDTQRSLVGSKAFMGNVIEGWPEKGQKEKDEIKNRFQIFQFIFNLTTSQLQIVQSEPFPQLNQIELSWTLYGNNENLSMGRVSNINFENNVGEVPIPIKTLQYEKKNLWLDVKIEVQNNAFPFQKGDIIAIGNVDVSTFKK